MQHELREHYLQRHWCPYSEEYTGCDSLLTALDNGWLLERSALQEEHWFNGRRVMVYHFFLHRDTQIERMRVIHTPYVDTLIKRHRLNIVSPASEYEMFAQKVRLKVV